MKLLDQSAKTNWKFIAIVAVLGLVVAGGILMLIPQLQEQTLPLPQQNISKINPSGPPSNSVEGWQTYRNEEFGFEMKYPRDWNPVEIIDGLGRLQLYGFQTSDGRVDFSVHKEQYNGTLDEYLSSKQKILEDAEGAHYRISEKEIVEIGKNEAIKIIPCKT